MEDLKFNQLQNEPLCIEVLKLIKRIYTNHASLKSIKSALRDELMFNVCNNSHMYTDTVAWEDQVRDFALAQIDSVAMIFFKKLIQDLELDKYSFEWEQNINIQNYNLSIEAINMFCDLPKKELLEKLKSWVLQNRAFGNEDVFITSKLLANCAIDYDKIINFDEFEDLTNKLFKKNSNFISCFTASIENAKNLKDYYYTLKAFNNFKSQKSSYDMIVMDTTELNEAVIYAWIQTLLNESISQLEKEAKIDLGSFVFDFQLNDKFDVLGLSVEFEDLDKKDKENIKKALVDFENSHGDFLNYFSVSSLKWAFDLD